MEVVISQTKFWNNAQHCDECIICYTVPLQWPLHEVEMLQVDHSWEENNKMYIILYHMIETLTLDSPYYSVQSLAIFH